jgi:hypothetical protein
LQIRDFPDPAHEFLDGLMLGFPPSFKERSDLNVETHWENGRVLPRNSFYEFRDKQAAFNTSGPIHGAGGGDRTAPFARFCGMLAGAMGWDPMHDIPPSLEESNGRLESRSI